MSIRMTPAFLPHQRPVSMSTPCAALRVGIPGAYVQTLAFRAVARSATHRSRPAPWPRARTGARAATLPWRGGRGAGKAVPLPQPRRRRPAGVVQRLRVGPSPRRAAHLRAADKAHGRADGIDHGATGRL